MTTEQRPTKAADPDDINQLLDTMQAQYSWGSVLPVLLLGSVAGIAIAAVVVPVYVDGLARSLIGDSPKAYWYVARSAGVVAYALVWLSVVWGLLLSTSLGKTIGKVASFVDVHRHVSVLSVVLTLVHSLVLLGDRYIGYTITSIFVPYASTTYRPFEVALGQIALYLLLIVTGSFWVRQWTGQKLWRAIHYLSFVICLLVGLHALWAGTDTAVLWYAYLTTTLVVVFLTIFRLVSAFDRSTTRPAGPA
jgi:predicted ferric reductase